MIPTISAKSRAIGSGHGISVVIEPSTTIGYSYIGVVNYQTGECVWTHRPVRMDTLSRTLMIMAADAVDLEWSVSETDDVASKSMLSSETAPRHR
jgi:hypothetical protein